MPAKPALYDVKSVPLELVDKPRRRKPWRPTIMTIRAFIKIAHHIEVGASIPDACKTELISYRTFRRHVANSSRLQERLKEAETIRFNLRQEQAMKSVMEHGKYSWLAHAWWLERCRPDLFALRPVVRDTSDIAEQPLLDKISMEQLIENAKLAAEVAANPPPGLAPKQLTSDISVEQCS